MGTDKLENEIGTDEFGPFGNIDILRVNIADTADKFMYHQPWNTIRFETRVKIEMVLENIFLPIRNEMENEQIREKHLH